MAITQRHCSPTNSLDLGSTGYFPSDEEQCLAVQRGSRRNQEMLTMLIYQHSVAVCHSAPRTLGEESFRVRGQDLGNAIGSNPLEASSTPL